MSCMFINGLCRSQVSAVAGSTNAFYRNMYSVSVCYIFTIHCIHHSIHAFSGIFCRVNIETNDVTEILHVVTDLLFHVSHVYVMTDDVYCSCGVGRRVF